MILESDTKHTPEQFKAKKAPPREGTSHLLMNVSLLFFVSSTFSFSFYFSASVDGGLKRHHVLHACFFSLSVFQVSAAFSVVSSLT